MKHWMTLLVFALALCLPWASAEALTPTDPLAMQTEIDAMLLAESAAGYDFEQPLVVLNPYGNAPLSAVAIFTTEEAVGGTVTVKGHAPEDDITGSFPAETDHFVPVVGLYAGEVNDVELTLDDGRSVSVQVETEPLDLGLRDYSVEMLNAELYDHSNLTVCGNMILHCYAGYDSAGALRWALTNTGANAITRLDNGRFLIPNQYGHGAEFPNGLTGIREVDPLGKVYNVYVWDGGEHHEIIVLPNGNYMVTGSRPGYETNRDYLFEIDPATGDIPWELDIAELVTPGSSGCESDKGADWCHSNALAYDEASDTLLISCRHLCAVLALEKESKTLKWILGDPAGWAEEYQDYLLKPVGDDFGWAYGQHQLTLLSNGDLLMFDNGEFGRQKAVNADQALADEDNYSRAVIYRIHEAEGTVEEIWSYGEALGSECYASSMSGIQCLDEAKGRYLITFGTCVNENGDTAAHIQLIENDACFWHMDYVGSSTYRGYRYPLYAEGMYDPGVEGQWHGDMSVTKQIELGDVDFTAAQPAPEGVKVDLYPFNALRFYGGFPVEDEDLLTDYAVALVGQDGATLGFDLGYTVNRGETIRANLSRWVSLKELPSDTYTVYLVMNGQAYDTGRTVTVE